MTKYWMAQIAAMLNLLGAFLVFLSFQATSTDLLLVMGKDKSTAFCVGQNAILAEGPDGSTILGTKCPEGSDAKPAAVVNTDSPGLAKFGWIILAVGFFLQMFSIEKPRAPIIPHASYGPRQRSPKNRN
jgi:hypothetical protein